MIFCLSKVMLKLCRKNACFSVAGGYASDSMATGRVTQTTHVSQQKSQTSVSNNKQVKEDP